MENAGFIFGSYILTLGAVLVFAVVTLRRAKQASKSATDQDKTWL